MVVALLVFLLAVVAKSVEVAGQSCEPCLCSNQLISCTGRELVKVPDVDETLRATLKTMDLRFNNIRFIDMNMLEGLEYVDIRNNPIKCTDMIMELARCVPKQLCLKTDCNSPIPETTTTEKTIFVRGKESTLAITNMIVTVLAYIISAITLYMLRRLLTRMFTNIDDIRRRITRMAPWTRPRTDIPPLPQRERVPFNERGRY